MNGLLFLTSNDFYKTPGENGNLMCNSIAGISLILFYSTACNHCQTLIPIFKKLPMTLGGCQFGIINISNNKNCVVLSQDTVTPIKFVPYIVLYIDGKPFMRYQGPYDINQLTNFVIEVSKNIQNKKKFIQSNARQHARNQAQRQGQHGQQSHGQSQQHSSHYKQEAKGKTIPPYAFGNPLYGDSNVSYLEFDTAYNN